MTDKAHPFQTPALDEVLRERPQSPATIAASPQAVKVHKKLSRAGKFAEKVSLPWRKKTSAAPPEAQPGPSLNAPTPERLAKEDPELGIERVSHVGGQVSHRAKSILETYREHFTSAEGSVAQQLCDDAEWATRQRTICSRTYSGMPHAGGADPSAIDSKRSLGMARFEFTLKRLTPEARAAALTLIVGTRREIDGRGMTVQQFTAMASNYGSKNTAGPFTVGYMKCLLSWIHALHQDFAHWRARGIEDARAQQIQLDRIRTELRSQIHAEISQEFQVELRELERLRAAVPAAAELGNVSRET